MVESSLERLITPKRSSEPQSVRMMIPDSDLFFFSPPPTLSRSLALTVSLRWAVVRLVPFAFSPLGCLVTSLSEPVKPGVLGFFQKFLLSFRDRSIPLSMHS